MERVRRAVMESGKWRVGGADGGARCPSRTARCSRRCEEQEEQQQHLGLMNPMMKSKRCCIGNQQVDGVTLTSRIFTASPIFHVGI